MTNTFDSLVRPPAAALIRKRLTRAGVLGVRLIGPPGSGKTELILATLKRVTGPLRIGVIVVNPAAERDAQRLRDRCAIVEHIETAVPTAASVWNVVHNLNLDRLDILLIEARDGLAPLEDLGQDATVAAFAVSGGDDKAVEYANLIHAASAVVLTKVDLHPLVNFSDDVFRRDVKTLNESAEILGISSVNGAGLMLWLDWLEVKRTTKKWRQQSAGKTEEPAGSDSFFG